MPLCLLSCAQRSLLTRVNTLYAPLNTRTQITACKRSVADACAWIPCRCMELLLLRFSHAQIFLFCFSSRCRGAREYVFVGNAWLYRFASYVSMRCGNSAQEEERRHHSNEIRFINENHDTENVCWPRVCVLWFATSFRRIGCLEKKFLYESHLFALSVCSGRMMLLLMWMLFIFN